MHRDLNDDKPFVCPVVDCGMRFINEDHLNVHSKKHEMSLALNSGGLSSNSPAHHFLDQTPTPTKFLKNIDEISLFQELAQNPFDHAYKKALDNDPPLPGPQTGDLNTPTLILSDSLKSSCGSTALPMGVDKMKGSEPLKPSPLAKTSTNKVVLDLSGKSVMVSQSVKQEALRRSMNSQETDNTHTTASYVANTISPSQQIGQVELVQHQPNVLTFQQHPAASSSTAAPNRAQQMEFIKQEIKREQQTPNLVDSSSSFGDQQQQCTMQVLLQLPNGETVPICIPATINKLQYLGSGQTIQQPVAQQQQHQQQQQQPQLQPAPSKIAASTNLTATMALKQRLKAQLQNQLSPTAKSSDVTMAASSPVMLSTNPLPAAGNSSQVLVGSTSPIMMVDSPGSEMNLSDSSDYSFDGKHQKMSPESGDPEERRRKFLERNRAAAARCRQKRKHWISNLEKKADELQSTNLRLQSEVKLLRGEVAQLKTLLLAHKDCPVTQQQRLQGQLQHIILTDPSLTSQELAQVVPTSDTTTESLHLNSAIVTFLQESVAGHQHHLEMNND